MRVKWLMGVCVSALAAAGPLASAQDEATPDKPTQVVYVRDSGLATEKLALAAKLERQKDWSRAADVYQEISTKYADRVIATQNDADGQPTQYVSAAVVVQDKLAKWPADGLAAYRRRFEDAARDLFNAADPGDLIANRRVTTLYFVTAAGKDAALRLLTGSFERGDFAAAAFIGRRLLDVYPDLVAERATVLFQTAVAEHLAGKDADAARHAADLKAHYAEATASVAGVDTRLADAAAQALATPAEVAGGFRSDDWPGPFGTPAADAVPDAISAGGARLFSIELPASGPRNIPSQTLHKFQQQAASDRLLGTMTGILPAVDGGDLFFQDNARVYAISLASGLPLPGWTAAYPGNGHGAFAIDALPTPRGKQMTVSVAGDNVVALLGQYDPVAAQIYGQQPPQLVCLDRDTGRRKWSMTPQKLKLPDDLAGLRDGAYFYGSPLLVGDTVYTLVHANRGNQFDECYLVALDAGDGAYRWATYVASTSLGNRVFDFDNNGDVGPATTAQVSAAGGRLYVLTNLGAVACLDGGDGHVVWLDVYPRQTIVAPRRLTFGISRRTAVKPFEINPPLVSNGRVFVLPADSPSLLVYDAASGDLLRSLSTQLQSRLAPAEMLLATVGDSVLLASRNALFKVPWKTYDPAHALNGKDGLYKVIPAGDGEDGDKIGSFRGRPFVSGKYVLTITNEKLSRVTVDSLKVESYYPSQGKWDDEEGPGNVIATPDNLIIAGPSRVTAYADLSVATAKLDARIAQNPDDVDAYLRYAELLTSAGRPDDALAELDTAAAKLGGPDHLRRGVPRDRLFAISLDAAVKAQRAGQPSDAPAKFYDRAAAAADTPVQQVQYRMTRAAYAHKQADAKAELALYQEILADADWRAAPVVGAQGGSTGGVEAEAAVAELVRGNGATIYATYEAAAVARVDALKNATPVDPDALVAVADEFPVSAQATEALSLAADAFEDAHQPRRATQTLRRLLRRDLSNERQLVVLQGLARNYLMVPNQLDAAVVWLRHASDLSHTAKLIKPLMLPDGKTLAEGTVADAMVALADLRRGAPQRALPAFAVPLTTGGGDPTKPPLQHAQDVIPADTIVDQQTDLARNDRVVTVGLDRRVRVVTADTAAVALTDAVLADAPLGCGFSGDALAVVGPQKATAVDAGGKTLWSIDPATLPRADVTTPPAATVADADDGPQQVIVNRNFNGRPRNWLQMRLRPGAVNLIADTSDTPAAVDGPERFAQFRLLSDRVVLATTTGRLMAVDAQSGKTLWQTRLTDQPHRHLLSNDDFVVVSYGDPAAVSDVYALDAVTGHVLLHKSYDPNANPPTGGLINLALSPDGVLVTLLPSRITSVDLYDKDLTEHKHEAGRLNQGEMPFLASNADGQLVITADRVLAVFHSSTSSAQSVRTYDLRTLKPVAGHEDGYSPRGNEREDGPVTIVASGSSFYLVGTRSLAGYNLDHEDTGWNPLGGIGNRGLNQDLILTREMVVQISQVALKNPGATRLPAIGLAMYNRATVPTTGSESGALEQRLTLRDPAGFMAQEWQIADDAFFYISGDQKLKVVRVNR